MNLAARRKSIEDMGFFVLPGRLESPPDVTCTQTKKWRKTLRAVRNRGVNTIFLSQTTTPSPSDVGPAIDAVIRKRLKAHTGIVCEVCLSWKQDGVLYSMVLEEPWWSNTKRRLNSERHQQRVVEDCTKTVEKTIESLVPEIVKWAAKQRLRKVTQADVDWFLREKGASFPYLLRREILSRVKLRGTNKRDRERGIASAASKRTPYHSSGPRTNR